MDLPICEQSKKKIYPDQAVAEVVLATLKRRGHGEQRGYQCPFCNGWHLTSLR